MLTIEQTEIVETAIDLIATKPWREGRNALSDACIALGIYASPKTIFKIQGLESIQYWLYGSEAAEKRIESLLFYKDLALIG